MCLACQHFDFNCTNLRSKRFQSSYWAKVRAEANIFFCSCPSFLNEPREETLATQATTAPIGSPIICMWSPADICEQCETNLSFSSADVRVAGTCDEPLRMSAWEAREGEERFWNSLAASQPKLSRGSKKKKTKQKNRPADLTGRPSVLWLLHVVQQGT